MENLLLRELAGPPSRLRRCLLLATPGMRALLSELVDPARVAPTGEAPLPPLSPEALSFWRALGDRSRLHAQEAFAVALRALLVGAVLAALVWLALHIFWSPGWRAWALMAAILSWLVWTDWMLAACHDAWLPRWRRWLRNRFGYGPEPGLLDDPGYSLALLSCVALLVGVLATRAGLVADLDAGLAGVTLLLVVWLFLGNAGRRFRFEAIFLAVAAGTVAWSLASSWRATTPMSVALLAGAVGTAASIGNDMLLARYARVEYAEVRSVFNISAIPVGLILLLIWNLTR